MFSDFCWELNHNHAARRSSAPIEINFDLETCDVDVSITQIEDNLQALKESVVIVDDFTSSKLVIHSQREDHQDNQ